MSAVPKTRALTPDTPVQYLRGVGPHIAQLFERKGIHTAWDVLHDFPTRYVDRRTLHTVRELPIEKRQTLLATVVNYASRPLGRSRRKILEMVVKDDTGFAKAVFFHFNEAYLKKRFPPDTQITLFGDVTRYGAFKQLVHPEMEEWDEDETGGAGILPFYALTEGLYQRTLRKIMRQNLDDLLSLVEDDPRTVRASGEVAVALKDALRAVHEPPADADIEALNQQKSAFHQRIVYDEFFYLELAMLSKRAKSELKKSFPIVSEDKLLHRARTLLPFTLTEGQENSLADIKTDFASGHPMSRLLQGDVGSGKTMVAFLSALMAIEAGWQVALMVPTEILAEQHFKNLVRYETDLGIRMELLTSSTPEKRRREILADLADGRIGLLVGTHALLTPDVIFQKLAYVIIDEQHRFGVMQRAQLRHKVRHQEENREPHLLFMTATPIPRTLSTSVYGDLTVSVIKHRPAGRQPIQTKLYYDKQRPQAYKFIQAELKKGRQAYFIYPLVEESEKLSLRDATLMHKELCGVFEGYQVGLLHGRMKAVEKEHVMGRFKAGEIHVLVSTTVVEVGVDVPNATVMVIEHAERFGLSQLHQLRGRVGRGKEQSHCILMAGYAQSEDTRYRLSVMTETDDGFVIAEEDLKLRGPGDFLGTKQSGLPDFHLAHLIRDGHLLQAARKRAEEILHEDPELIQPINRLIASVMRGRWEKRLDLTHV